MTTALKNNVINFNSYREQRVQLHSATPATHHETDQTAINAAAQVVVWWPVWVFVPQQAEARTDNVVTIN